MKDISNSQFILMMLYLFCAGYGAIKIIHKLVDMFIHFEEKFKDSYKLRKEIEEMTSCKMIKKGSRNA